MGSASLISNVNQFSAIVDLDSGDVNTDVSRHDKVVVATAVVPRDGEVSVKSVAAVAMAIGSSRRIGIVFVLLGLLLLLFFLFFVSPLFLRKRCYDPCLERR